jgi:hypothetical protein
MIDSWFELFALAVAGANGGLVYWAVARRRELLARVRARR